MKHTHRVHGFFSRSQFFIILHIISYSAHPHLLFTRQSILSSKPYSYFQFTVSPVLAFKLYFFLYRANSLIIFRTSLSSTPQNILFFSFFSYFILRLGRDNFMRFGFLFLSPSSSMAICYYVKTQYVPTLV